MKPFTAKSRIRDELVTCGVCRVTKLGEGNFRHSGNSKTGYEYRCKQCTEKVLTKAEQRMRERWEEAKRQRLEELQRGLEGKAVNKEWVKRAGHCLLRPTTSVQAEHRSPTQVIYTLVDPRTNAVHYVGRTGNPKRRYERHLYGRTNRAKVTWISELRALGLRPLMIIVEHVKLPTRKAIEREIRWIYNYFQQRAPLTNHEAIRCPRLVKAIQDTQVDFLVEPLRSKVWYPLYCAAEIDLEERFRMRQEMLDEI